MSNGGFLAGFTQGLGGGIQDLNQNLMEMQLRRYAGAARIWESMAKDPTYHPSIRQEFTKNAAFFASPNLFDKDWRKQADKLVKQNPQEHAQAALQAMEAAGTQLPAYYNKMGQVDELELQRHKTRVEQEEEASGIQRRMEALGSSGLNALLSGGVDPKHPAFQEVTDYNKARVAMKQPPERFQRTVVNGLALSYWPPSGKHFLSLPDGSAVEVDPWSVREASGRKTVQTIRYGQLGERIGTETISQPVPFSPNLQPPANATGQPPAAQPHISQPPPQAAPGSVPTEPPAQPQEALPIAETKPRSLEERFPNRGSNRAEQIAYGLANDDRAAWDSFKKLNSIGQSNVYSILRQQGVITLDDKELVAARDSKKAEELLLRMTRLAADVFNNPLSATIRGKVGAYNKLRQGLGSVFARRTFEQVGQMAVIEQQWARAPIPTTIEAVLGGIVDAALKGDWKKYNILRSTAVQSIEGMQAVIQSGKTGLMQPRTGDWIAGIGPRSYYEGTGMNLALSNDELIRLAGNSAAALPEPTGTGQITPPPMGAAGVLQDLKKQKPSTQYHPHWAKDAAGRSYYSDDGTNYFDAETGQPYGKP